MWKRDKQCNKMSDRYRCTCAKACSRASCQRLVHTDFGIASTRSLQQSSPAPSQLVRLYLRPCDSRPSNLQAEAAISAECNCPSHRISEVPWPVRISQSIAASSHSGVGNIQQAGMSAWWQHVGMQLAHMPTRKTVTTVRLDRRHNNHDAERTRRRPASSSRRRGGAACPRPGGCRCRGTAAP
jgi:hypothetical protein